MSKTSLSQDNSNVFSNHAMIKNADTKVLAVVNVPGDYSVSGFKFIKSQAGIYCAAGMFYDSRTELFYDDESFTTINGIVSAQVNSFGQTESSS